MVAASLTNVRIVTPGLSLQGKDQPRAPQMFVGAKGIAGGLVKILRGAWVGTGSGLRICIPAAPVTRRSMAA